MQNGICMSTELPISGAMQIVAFNACACVRAQAKVKSTDRERERVKWTKVRINQVDDGDQKAKA